MRKRIVFFAACHNIGGFETKLDTLVRNLNPDRYEIHVLLLYPYYKAQKAPEPLRKRQRAFFRWPHVPTHEVVMKYRLDVGVIFRTALVLKKLRPNIVIFFALGPGTFAGPLACLLAGVKCIIRMQDTVLNGLYPRILRPLDQFLVHATSFAIVPSFFLKNILIQGLPFSPSQVHVIPNGIDLSKFSEKNPDSELQQAIGSHKVIGMIANLVPVKNHEMLFQAIPSILRRFPNTHFVLVGDGPLRKKLEEEARCLGISGCVHFLGYRSDVHRILPLFHMGVLCSHVEVHPISLIEIQAMGIPVVAPNVGGIPEVVQDGKTGILIPANSPESFAEAICELLSHPQKISQLGKEAKAWVHREFTIDRMIRRLDAFLEGIN